MKKSLYNNQTRKSIFYKINGNRQHISSLVKSSNLINIEIRYNSPADRTLLRLARVHLLKHARYNPGREELISS